MKNTIEWFRKHGSRYRSRPWNYFFLRRYPYGKALDMGSGLASTTKHLLVENVIKYLVLLDLSFNTLRNTCISDPRIQCIVGDILDPPFKSNSFNTVFLLATLHHIPGHECRLYVLKKVYEILSGNGVLIITVWNPSIEVLLKRNVRVIDERDYILVDRNGSRYYHIYGMEELIEDVRETGFNIIDKGYFIQTPSREELTRNIYIIAEKS